MFNRLSTRSRSIIASVLTGLLLFILISPTFKYLIDVVTSPSEIKNISILQKNKELDISWKKATESDISGYQLYLNNKQVNKDILLKDVDNYEIYDLDNSTQYQFRIESKDNSGNVSKSINYDVKPSEKTSSLIFNQSEEANQIKDISLIAILISTILFILNLWVLFFKIDLKTAITIGAFPSITLIPYFILSLSVLQTLNSPLNKILTSLVISIIYIFISYLLILTSNILNGSQFKKLPLEQAAKASQFIFGLISTYLILIYIFSANLLLINKLIIFLSFVIYFTYSSLSLIKAIKTEQVVIRVVSITAIMSLSIIILSIWPLDSIYAILAIAVIYYILLNIVLEIRNKVGKGLWIEYLVLILLVILLLVTNAAWGIRGTLI